MDTNKGRKFNIEAGPSRDLLFDSAKYAYDADAHVFIKFSVALGYTMPLGHPGCAYIPAKMVGTKIVAIEHEDGSGYSFNLQGYCEASLERYGDQVEPYKFFAYYNAKTRKGTITFVK